MYKKEGKSQQKVIVKLYELDDKEMFLAHVCPPHVVVRIAEGSGGFSSTVAVGSSTQQFTHMETI